MTLNLTANSPSASRLKGAHYDFFCRSWDPSELEVFEYPKHIVLIFIESGSISFLQDKSKLKVKTGQLCIFWSKAPHCPVDFDKNTRGYITTTPLQNLFLWDLPEGFIQAILNGSLLLKDDPQSSAIDQIRFKQWAAEIDLVAKSGLEHPGLLELQAMLLRMSEQLPESSLSKLKKLRTTTSRSIQSIC